MMRAWRTPTDDSRRGGAQTPEKRLAGNHTVNLADQALGWPTPKASDGSKPSAGKRRKADLDHRARLWPTPNVPNGGRVNPPGTSATGQAPDGSKKQIGLEDAVRGLLGRQVLKTGTAGGDSSGARRTLNPLFVETLMGWPTGWTGFGSAATAWCHWLPRMRGELSRLGSTAMDEAA